MAPPSLLQAPRPSKPAIQPLAAPPQPCLSEATPAADYVMQLSEEVLQTSANPVAALQQQYQTILLSQCMLLGQMHQLEAFKQHLLRNHNLPAPLVPPPVAAVLAAAAAVALPPPGAADAVGMLLPHLQQMLNAQQAPPPMQQLAPLAHELALPPGGPPMPFGPGGILAPLLAGMLPPPQVPPGGLNPVLAAMMGLAAPLNPTSMALPLEWLQLRAPQAPSVSGGGLTASAAAGGVSGMELTGAPPRELQPLQSAAAQAAEEQQRGQAAQQAALQQSVMPPQRQQQAAQQRQQQQEQQQQVMQQRQEQQQHMMQQQQAQVMQQQHAMQQQQQAMQQQQQAIQQQVALMQQEQGANKRKQGPWLMLPGATPQQNTPSAAVMSCDTASGVQHTAAGPPHLPPPTKLRAAEPAPAAPSAATGGGSASGSGTHLSSQGGSRACFPSTSAGCSNERGAGGAVPPTVLPLQQQQAQWQLSWQQPQQFPQPFRQQEGGGQLPLLFAPPPLPPALPPFSPAGPLAGIAAAALPPGSLPLPPPSAPVPGSSTGPACAAMCSPSSDTGAPPALELACAAVKNEHQGGGLAPPAWTPGSLACAATTAVPGGGPSLGARCGSGSGEGMGPPSAADAVGPPGAMALGPPQDLLSALHALQQQGMAACRPPPGAAGSLGALPAPCADDLPGGPLSHHEAQLLARVRRLARQLQPEQRSLLQRRLQGLTMDAAGIRAPMGLDARAGLDAAGVGAAARPAMQVAAGGC